MLPVAVRLYLPKTWMYYLEQRQQALLLSEVPFQSKPEVVLALPDHGRAWRPGRIHIWWRYVRISR
jgi:hypothetical protein